jgi:3-phosphoshikimate 1-carboxyvinyltransferase
MPGDKSISHRAAMIAALATGVTRVTNFSTSADCQATLSCLSELGVSIEHRGSQLLVHGVGTDGLHALAEPLDCRNSGTTMRLLAGILAGQNFNSTLTGDESLRSRPMQRIIEPLTMMGASISSTDGRAPLVIEGQSPLRALNYELPIASAQVKSCILLAGLGAAGQTHVVESQITRDHTERMLRWFGVPLEVRDVAGSRAITVNGPARFNPRDVSIPGDVSSSSFFIAAAALLPGSSLEITGVGVNPTRVTFLEQLRSLGFDVAVSNLRDECNEPIGTIRVSGARSSSESAAPLRGSVIPQLIDELPLLVVVGSQIEGGFEIRDAAELRAKESDRIAATVQNLRAMGAEVEEFKDGLRVAGPVQLRGATIDPRGDHRIAMAFSVAALIARGETDIRDAQCVAVSFPEFFELLESVIER